MSKASRRIDARTEPRIDRLQPWIAALISALLHVLLLLLLLFSSKPVVSTPQGASGGSRMKVDFLGEPRETQPGPPSPPPPAAPVRKRRATSQVRTTLVATSPDPVPPEDLPVPEPQREVPTPPQPSPSADDDWSRLTRRPAASPPAPRRTQTWTGHPPGWAPQDTAMDNHGVDSGPGYTRGHSNDAGGQPSMEVGGYQVYYDMRSETLLRTWKDQGMKELSIPLPGTSYRMVCELDIAIRRGSGKCRLLDPGSPEMQTIGDGREVINMIQVYKQGEVVWRGPGPYR